MRDVTRNRRARLRAETTEEIQAIALRLLAGGGPDAVTLRAIAREMGMTAGAIYGYFATRDELITTLIQGVYGDLVDAVETARDARLAEDTAGRIIAWGEAFRGWSVANPQGFRLIYGDPVPGYAVPEGGAAPGPAHRACSGLVELVAAAWPSAELRQGGGGYRWADFDSGLVSVVRADFPKLPPAGVALALRVWGRMHGLVALEIYGHLGAQTGQSAELYGYELRDLVVSLGLTPPEW
ncbi:TetR/AcrR family transcriptional regulator [Crossiella sp. CA198]|uniref:TetR/AcrR family transcriptional regulator n=1 Tax=Crossiella sp. CA198 TaxID=3455607 RepID=UPI003F8D7C01